MISAAIAYIGMAERLAAPPAEDQKFNYSPEKHTISL
jgi:hypothetical protein